MSDPIAAAEAAGKARDIANRFETAVFLIAYGIAEKDGLYEADPHRYPYSQAFRHGMNILAALCAECSDDAEELLPTFNESDFIRNSAASDVREWTARWRDECREAVEGCRSIEIGPLASVDGDYFAATSECYEVLRFAENDLLGGHQERRVYEFLRAGTQEQYAYGRRMLIRHPLLTWNEYVRIKTGLALGDPDPLDQGEADTIDPVWLQEFVSMAYEHYLRGVEHLAGPLGAIGGADPRRDFQRAVDRRAVREVQRGDAGGRQGEEIDVARLQVRYEGVEHVALARAGVAREEHVPPVPQRAQRLGLFRCKAVTVCHFHIPSSVRPVTGN